MMATEDSTGVDAQSALSGRPWPAPDRSWAVAMQWRDLLFAHWPVSVEALRDRVPGCLDIDTFGGQAWLGVVPFRMTGVRARWMPALPGVARFAELNVRTYVTAGGKAGVYFFSLDAASRLAVRAARATFCLPYFDAAMSSTALPGGQIAYASHRTHRGVAAAAFKATYRPTAGPKCARTGSLEHFLTERYCLYTTDRKGRPMRGEIDHEPWPLQPAEAEIELNQMCHPIGIDLPDTAPLLHFARRLDVAAWWLARL